jgi:hypothetical protein
LPPPALISATEALQVIDSTFLTRGAVFALTDDAYIQLLRSCAATGIVGGQVYDALIAVCARMAGAEVLLTFNERHFRRFGGDGLSIVVP